MSDWSEMNERQIASRAFWSAMDSIETGQAPDVHESSDEEVEHVSDAAVGGVQDDEDTGGRDPGRESEAIDSGTSEPRAVGSGEETDEGVGAGSDNPPEQDGDDVLEPDSGERVHEETPTIPGYARDFAVIPHALGRF